MSSDPDGVKKASYRIRYNNKLENHTREARLELPNTDILKLINERKLLE